MTVAGGRGRTAGLVVLAGLTAVLAGIVARGEHGHPIIHPADDGREAALRREIATLTAALDDRRRACAAPAVPRSATPPGASAGGIAGGQGSGAGSPPGTGAGGGAGPGGGGSGGRSPGGGEPPAGPAPHAGTPTPMPSVPGRGAPAPLPAACLDRAPEAPPADVVLIFDTSLSMRLPVTLSLAEELALRGGRTDGGDGPNSTALRDLMEAPGEKRLDVARRAATALVRGLPPASQFGLVFFGREAGTVPLPRDQACDVHALGPAPGPDRGGQERALAAWPAKAWTPIARAIDRSAGLLDGSGGTVFLLTDGQETCHGDPCAAARSLKARHPDARVHVVDLMGNPSLHCIAAETGGELMRWTSAEAAAAFMLAAAAPAEHCPR